MKCQVNVFDRLIDLKRKNELKRLGKIFYTSRFAYLYDTGTGKVIMIDGESKKILEALFDYNVKDEEFVELLNSTENVAEIESFISAENLLCNPDVTGFIPLEKQVTEENFKCEQLIIELTGNCNLACKYCIYNEFFEGNRNFNTSNIDFETAKKAIDYVYAHRDPKQLAITFYGGEPLLNFKVMKQCIDYSLENLKDVDLSFSFTTNLTLMTEEIAEYLAQIPKLSILLSMDGPEEIQNMARVYKGGKGSFAAAFKGLKILAEAINRYKNTELIFNAVLMPPYTAERFDRINNFFENLDFLPENTEVRATYPSLGTIPETYYEELKENGIESTGEEVNWMSWAKDKGKGDDFVGKKMNIYTGLLETALTRIHNRALYDKPMNFYYYNGCCLPGQRRLYVCTDGSYKVCERIGTAPIIGDVNTGIDVEAIKKYYLKEYEEKSLPDCSQCWAINLCNICYAECYNEAGLDIKEKRKLCAETRNRYVMWLQYYHELLETQPDRIEEISKVKLV